MEKKEIHGWEKKERVLRGAELGGTTTAREKTKEKGRGQTKDDGQETEEEEADEKDEQDDGGGTREEEEGVEVESRS